MIETYTRKDKFASLEPYCHLAKAQYLNGVLYDFSDWLTARGSDATINT